MTGSAEASSVSVSSDALGDDVVGYMIPMNPLPQNSILTGKIEGFFNTI